MKVNSIPSVKNDIINVIVETPLGSRFKYAYDPDLDIMKVKHELPEGYSFPFNFGFIPNTFAGDGDPLDVLIYSNTPCLTGTLIEGRLIGALIANQIKNGRNVDNHRLIVVPAQIKIYDSFKTITDIDKTILKQLQNFFVSYENLRGISFAARKWVSVAQASRIVTSSMKKV